MEIVSQECLTEIEENLNIVAPSFELDGVIVRFGPKKKYWLVGHTWNYNSLPYSCVVYASWEDDLKFKWKSWSDGGREDESKTFQKRFKQVQKEIIQKQKELQLKRHQECRDKWKPLFEKAIQSSAHDYLVKKGIYDNFGAKTLKDMLLIPVYDWENWNGVQIISKDFKKFATGIKISGSFCIINNKSNPDKIYFCEGFATACTIYEATKSMVVVCFTCHNLLPVMKSFREKFQSSFVICADNDQWKSKKKNPGIDTATKIVSQMPGVTFVYPIFIDGENKPTDFNDLMIEEGLDEVKNQIIEKKYEEDIDAKYWDSWIKKGFSSITFDVVTRHVEYLRGYFQYKFNYITDHITREVYIYQNGFYSHMYDSEIEHFAQKHYSPIMKKDHEAKEFLKLVKRCGIIDVKKVKDKSASECLVNFKNCVYDYKNNKVLSHNHKFFFFNQIPYNYNPSAPSPSTWFELMDNLTVNRESLKFVITQFLGYCLSGMEYKFNKALILKGAGSNGKTSLINIFKMVLGKNNCSSVNVSELPTNRFRSIELDNKLVNFSEEEPPKKVFKDTGIFKAVTGDSTITVEQKGIPSRQIVSRAKIVMSYNEMPELHDFSTGLKRRLLIVPFDLNLEKNPERKIPDLYKKIENEIEGIIIEAMNHLTVLLRNGHFLPIEESEKEIEKMVKRNDPFLEFIDENINITGCENDYILFEDFCDSYFEANGKTSTKNKIGRCINALPEKLCVKKYKKRVYVGQSNMPKLVIEGMRYKCDH